MRITSLHAHHVHSMRVSEVQARDAGKDLLEMYCTLAPDLLVQEGDCQAALGIEREAELVVTIKVSPSHSPNIWLHGSESPVLV